MKDNKIALTIDLDDWYHSSLVTGANWSKYPRIETFYKDWKGNLDYITEPTKKLFDLLDKYSVRATLFIIADVVEHYPELVELIKSTNHEIACHSLHHTVPFNIKTNEITQSKKEWEDELKLAKNILEDTFQKPVFGYRAPSAYFADWMIPILKRNNFIYDSSIAYNSIFNKTNLITKQYSRNPFFIDDFGNVSQNADDLLEIPWPYFKLGPLALPGGGAFFFRLFGSSYFKKLLNQTLQCGDTVFYIHSLDLSDEKFPLQNFRYRPNYWVNKGLKTFKNLEILLSEYSTSICRAYEIFNRKIQK